MPNKHGKCSLVSPASAAEPVPSLC